LPPEQVRARAERDRGGRQQYWLPVKQYTVDEFKERWNLIGDPVNP